MLVLKDADILKQAEVELGQAQPKLRLRLRLNDSKILFERQTNPDIGEQ